MSTADSPPPSDKIARFADMKRRFPQSEMPRWSLANALIAAGRRDEAIVELTELVGLKPDYCVAWLELGRQSAAAGARDAARRAFEEALRLAIAQGHAAPRNEAEAGLEELDD